MKFKKYNDNFIIRMEKGDKILESLISFCRENKINCGFFSGIGASSYAEIMHYVLSTKKYSNRVLKEPLEIVSLSGNITQMNNEPYIHCHACFSDKYMKAYAGHLKEAIISATCEIFLVTLDAKATRRYDVKMGLNLIEF